MCTIAAMICGEKVFMLKNFDYRATPTGWVLFETFDGGHPHFALVDHAQQGLNSGLNAAGLGLQISRSRCEDPTPEREEIRTVLNGEVLAGCATVPEGVAHIESYASEHPEMLGGNVMLADGGHISVTEYFGGKAQSEVLTEGYRVRANHSVFGLIDNCKGNSPVRFSKMESFVASLYPQLPDLDEETIIERCRDRLRTPPILQPSTRSSFVIDIRGRRVDCCVGNGPWRTFRFAEVAQTANGIA